MTLQQELKQIEKETGLKPSKPAYRAAQRIADAMKQYAKPYEPLAVDIHGMAWIIEGEMKNHDTLYRMM